MSDFEETAVKHIDDLDLEVQAELFPAARRVPPPPAPRPAPKPLTWWHRRQLAYWSDVEIVLAMWGSVALFKFVEYAAPYVLGRVLP